MGEQELTSAVENLKKLKNMIATLSYEGNFSEWRDITQEILEEIFGAASERARTFKVINYTPLFMSTYMSVDKMEELFRRGLTQAEAQLSDALAELLK